MFVKENCSLDFMRAPPGIANEHNRKRASKHLCSDGRSAGFAHELVYPLLLSPAMNIVNCTHDRHASQILEVFNEAILSSTALFDYKPRTLESMYSWFKAKEAGRFPVIGIEAPDEKLLGFVSYGTFRAWPAYKYSIEHSVYVHKDHRGQGLGRKLMLEAIAAAKAQDYHVLPSRRRLSTLKTRSIKHVQRHVHLGTWNIRCRVQ
jgi:L-amino acid N-acyltransferase